MNLHDAAQNRNAAKGVLTQENIGFGLTILPPSAFRLAHSKSSVIRQDYRAFFTLLFAQNCRAGPWRQKALPPSLRERAVCSKVPLELLLPWAAAKLLRTSDAEIRVAEQGKVPPSAFGGVCLPAVSRYFTS